MIQEYEEFYDDVHSEFIQFGELVNFKVLVMSSNSKATAMIVSALLSEMVLFKFVGLLDIT